MMVYSIPICFVVDPVTLVYVSVNMGELAFTMRSIVFPLSFISGAIRPLLLSVAISEATNPFTTEGSTGLECVSRTFFTFGIRIIGPVL